MDKFACRDDYDVNYFLEKAIRDRSHLSQKVITDKNGHSRFVWVKNEEIKI